MLHLTDPILNEYLDGALPEVQRVEAGAHLAACPDCMRRLAALQGIFARIESLPEMPLQRDLSSAVLAAIRPSTTRPQIRLSPTFGLALGAQAVLALVALIAAIPFAVQLLPADPLAALTAQTSTSYSAFVNQWTAWLATIQGLGALPALPVPTLSVLAIAVTLVAAGVLFVVGNGVLLRQTLRTGH